MYSGDLEKKFSFRVEFFKFKSNIVLLNLESILPHFPYWLEVTQQQRAPIFWCIHIELEIVYTNLRRSGYSLQTVSTLVSSMDHDAKKHFSYEDLELSCHFKIICWVSRELEQNKRPNGLIINEWKTTIDKLETPKFKVTIKNNIFTFIYMKSLVLYFSRYVRFKQNQPVKEELSHPVRDIAFCSLPLPPRKQ